MKKNNLAVMFGILWVLIASTQGCSQSTADNPDSGTLTLERIFKHDEFRSSRFGPARWLSEKGIYTTLESSPKYPDSYDIVGYAVKSGERKVLVSAQSLIPAESGTPLEIEDYAWSEGGDRLLIFTNSKRVWRRNTRGDYWILDLSSGRLQKMGADAAPSSLMFAKFSPDGSRLGFVRGNNIFVEDLEPSRVVALTEDGSEHIINGTFDWVYEEELNLRDGFRWSPDGKNIAFWQLDSQGIENFYMINNTDSLYPELIPIRYPKVGTVNSAARIGVVSAEGGEIKWFDFPGNSRQHYLARMEWASSSEEIIVQRLNRLQNSNQVYLCNIRTGTVNEIFIDRDDAWVEVIDDLRWLEGGKFFTWVSERDGWKHIYLISRDGKDIRCLTPGDYDVESIECIDDREGWIYFIASPENPTQRYLFRIPLAGGTDPERLTPSGQPGTHSYQISDDAHWAFHTYSTFESPPVISLIQLPDHEVQRELIDNQELRLKVDALRRLPVEFFRVQVKGGLELDAWCIKPPEFEPSRHYPLFFFVYGEPAGTTVTDRWGGTRYLWHLMLAQQGYVVMSVDNRGTNVPRGREWRKSIYRRIGIQASVDQADAAKSILKERRYLDPGRVGIWGWSGGGSMSLNMIFRYPEIYRTALAVAFVADQRLYDTIYQERYMGLPEDNEAGYRDGSPINFAHRLEGNLLIVHGTGDDNVHYQNFERLVNKLIEHNKEFSMMAYPNRSHGISEEEGTTLHLYSLLTGFLKKNLPPENGHDSR